jgi:hypothetical protein
MDGELQSIFCAKRATLLSHVRFCVVCMNQEFSPIDLRAERKQFRENIIAVILCIKSPAFWKCIEQMEFQ